MITRAIDVEMKESYLDYAMSVIVGRAIPDVRDGLKPVQRRILYGMFELGLTHDKPHKKSARIVGEVMGKYHPHGDAPIYDALVRMAQDFSMRYPLVDGQGNFGSIDGDPAAAMRYTEARLSRVAEEMLEGIREDTVDFQPNFDGTVQEPVVLPSKFPNLLVNGSSGIAVGMATNLPPHNLNEIVDAIKYYIKNPNCSVEDLMEFVKGPDFPTGGIICGIDGIVEAYKKGRGIIKIRATAEIVERGKRKEIIIKDVPYEVKKSHILEKIAQLVRDKRIDGITDLRDESDREGIRVVIKLRPDVNAEVILNQLYESTPLESTYSIINLVLVDGAPKLLNLKELIEQYVRHRLEVITRQAEHRLRKAEDREHVLSGLLKALKYIDEIITLIKSSENVEEAKQKLIDRFKFTERQAKVILEMQLQRLTRLEGDKLKKEYDEIIQKIRELRELLASEELKLKRISEELDEIKKKYGDERRTKIEETYEKRKKEDLIPREKNIVVLSRDGYIKRISPEEFRAQRRGGEGIHGTPDLQDFVEINSHDLLLLFTNTGRVFSIKGYEIPKMGRRSRGKHIMAILNMKEDERIVKILPVSTTRGKYLYFVTEKGIVKRTSLSEFANIRSTGIRATRFRENDRLSHVLIGDLDGEILLFSRKGRVARFSVSEIPISGRNAIGVIGMRLDADDKIVSAVLRKKENQILIITENGYGKRILIEGKDGIRKTRRGAKGVIGIKVTSKIGGVVAAFPIGDKDEVIISTKKGTTIRVRAKEIPVYGRMARGVKVVKVDNDNTVTHAIRVV